MKLPVFFGGAVHYLTKCFGKVAASMEACLGCDFRDGFLTVEQQGKALLNPVI